MRRIISKNFLIAAGILVFGFLSIHSTNPDTVIDILNQTIDENSD